MLRESDNRCFAMHRTCKISLGILALLPALATAQSVYRWTDAEGNLRYSDRPPEVGTPYESRHLQESWRDSATEAAEPAPEQNPGDLEGRSESVAAAPQAVRNAEYCEQARENLWQLNHHARIRMLGEDGEYRFLSEEEKQAQRVKAQQVIDANC